MQITMCQNCAGPADELDHRLAINVARGAGTAGAQAGVHTREPAVVMSTVPPAQDTSGPQAREVPVGLFTGLERSAQGLETEPRLGGDLSALSLLDGCR